MVNNRNVQWKFPLAKVLKYGGFWKRLTGQVKCCLKEAIGKSALNFYQFQAILQ